MPHRGAVGRTLRLCSLAVMALATSGCLVYDEDVSTDPRYEAFYGRCFELKAAAFVWHWQDSKKLMLSIPGKRVEYQLPATTEEYRQHPTDWYRHPPYDTKFGIGSIGPGEIVAVVPQGSRFEVTKILLHHNIEVGEYLKVVARLNQPAPGIDELDLEGLIEEDWSTSRIEYDPKLVAPCPAVTPPGVKIGEKVAR